MAFPAGWPPRASSNHRSIRFFQRGVATADFADSAYLFGATAESRNMTPLPYVRPGSTDVVHVGDLQTPGSPMGAGRDPHDANYSYSDPAQQAVPVPMVWSHGIRIRNLGGADLEFSFDGVTVQGFVSMNTDMEYSFRHEAGIAIRGAGAMFLVEAW